MHRDDAVGCPPAWFLGLYSFYTKSATPADEPGSIFPPA